MKQNLEIGDVIQPYELGRKVGLRHTIISTTKTLAKSDLIKSFKLKLEYNTIKPDDNCIAEVEAKTKYGSRRYYLIKQI